MLGSDYITNVRGLVHDLTTQDWSDTELLTWVNRARQKVALDTHCVRGFFAGLSLITGQEIYPMTGGCGGVVVTAGGSNYSATPTVTLGAPPAGGIQATATAVVTNGVITAINMLNWGGGYTSNPSVNISDSTGSGASGTSVALVNVLDIQSCTLLYPGNVQSVMLTWWNFTRFQAWARSFRVLLQMPGVWTTLTELNQLYFRPIPGQPYTLEIDAALTATDLPTTATADTQIPLYWADCVEFYGAHLALLKLQNYEHADTYAKKYKARVAEVFQTKQTRRIVNVYGNTFRRVQRGA